MERIYFRELTLGMMPRVLVLLFVLWNIRPERAEAHSMYQAAVVLDFHGGTVEAELQLPVERLQTALGISLTRQSIDRESARVTEYIVSHFSATLADGRPFRIDEIGFPHLFSIDGAPYVVARFRLTPPGDSGADLFDLHCDVLLDRIPAQVTLVSTRTDWRTSTFANDPQLIGVLREGDRTVRIDRRDGNWWHGFGSLFRLGMRHIAEGTDHLLFLLALLLPAPLVAVHGEWWRYAGVRRCLLQIARVVTAFTLGHSVTLAAGAMDLVRVPSRLIETLIAVSILVSAVHAFRPIFPGREAVIAGCFGLVHGLAFATTLAELGLGPWERAAGIFGFNLGIEAMQLMVVAAALPSLILLSRSPVYSPIRIGGALFAGVAATGWIAQRLWGAPNPVDAVVAALAQRAIWIALGLTLLAIVIRRRSFFMRTARVLSVSVLTLVSLSGAVAQTATSRIVTAANTFLSTLDEKQRQSVVFAFDDELQRKRWSNFPIAMVPRGGMAMKDMTPAQRSAAMDLVSAALSKRGFEKVQQIMEGDEANKTSEGNGPPRGGGNQPQFGRGPDGPPNGRGGNRPPPDGRGGGGPRGGRGGGGAMFGKDLYYVSILGTPSEKNPWMLQFGGHHLALNITIAGERGILTPTLTGAQPALFTLNGKTVRPLGGESDKALELLNSLDENQRKQAILNYRVADLVLGPGQDGKTIQPEGLKASNMNDKQRAVLLDVIAEWAGIIHESAAAERMAELKADLNETWFAWSGATTAAAGRNITAYYRIQGPHLVIEYSPQQLGGDPSLHVHTMYRDPTNDYGRKPGEK